MRWQTAQWFERRWWRNYLKDKPVDEYITWKKAYWHDFLQGLDLGVEAHHSAIDLGCGPAGIFTILPCKPLHALDPLVEVYERELPHFARTTYPHVHFLPSTLEDAVFNQQYDFVFCLNAINHVRELQHAMQRLHDACRSGGQLVLSIDAHNFTALKWLFRLIPGDILHPHQHSLKDYCEMLTKQGFRIERTVPLKSGFLFDYHAIIAQKI